MTRLHIALSVADLDRSIAFYTELFKTGPSVLEADYAKWMLDDPHVNLSLSTHGANKGVDHVGLEAGDEAELNQLRARLEAAEGEIFEQPDVTCCYAKSKKAWIRDPDGVAWETFFSTGRTAHYGDGGQDRARLANPAESACCAPG